jgi:hypothetical protein
MPISGKKGRTRTTRGFFFQDLRAIVRYYRTLGGYGGRLSRASIGRLVFEV